jgi:hypothetical protein
MQLLSQDIRDFLTQQLNRASSAEQIVMTHLALAGDWVTLPTLQTELDGVVDRQELLDLLDSLYRRSLFQKNGTNFKLSQVMTDFIQTRKAVRYYRTEAAS